MELPREGIRPGRVNPVSPFSVLRFGAGWATIVAWSAMPRSLVRRRVRSDLLSLIGQLHRPASSLKRSSHAKVALEMEDQNCWRRERAWRSALKSLAAMANFRAPADPGIDSCRRHVSP